MDATVSATVLAMATATVLAGVVALSGATLQDWVRRVILLIFNRSPWTIGCWRRSFTQRESVIAAWFLGFMATWLFCLLRSRRGG